jgi:putative exporter of polyketide antibiotics
VFGGVAAIGAQLAVTARGARGIAIAALGAAFVLRAVGPKLSGTVSAASLLWLCAVALTIGAAGLIGLRHRDLGDLGPSRPVGAVRDRIVAYASFEPSQRAAEHE